MTATINSKNIAIRPSKSYLKELWGQSWHNPASRMFAWTQSPPFVVNHRGILTHRVRHVTTHFWNGKQSHYSVNYLCGNQCCVDLDLIAESLVSDPPSDRFLCESCERRAVREKKPSGDELAGRHVHRGVLVARQTCCGDE